MIGPGIFSASQTSELPLPISGYELYLIGETHGEQEVNDVGLDYLERLHAACGLRDIALELSQYYEPSVNEYMLGLRDDLPDPEYWSLTDKMAVLEDIREHNANSPEEMRIRVHLVDLDLGAAMIHAHLQALMERMEIKNGDLQLPSVGELEKWNEGQMLALVDRFANRLKDQVEAAYELNNIRYSVRNYILMRDTDNWENVADERSAIREAAISANIEAMLTETGRSPALVIFGAWHTQKRLGMRAIRGPTRLVQINELPWAQRLSETGLSIFSLYVGGISGSTKFRDSQREVALRLDQFHFSDSKTLAEALGDRPVPEIIYIDLRLEPNRSAHYDADFDPLGAVFDARIPAGEIFDGLLLFREVTPVKGGSVDETG